MLKRYIPVDCGFHDEIEAAIVLQKSGCISYLDEHQKQFMLEDTKVLTWINRNNEEFMVLSNGLEIRLDQVIHFMGLDILGGYCLR